MINFTNFTVFDFETTGLDAASEQIIEACVIRVRNGAITSTYNTLVNLAEGHALAPEVTKLTGYTQDDLKDGIREDTLAHILYELLGLADIRAIGPVDPAHTELLVAHNALFDMAFLETLFNRHGLLPFKNKLPNQFIDTLTIARGLEPYPHKLEDICKRNGILLEGAHSAFNDSLALVDVVLHYVDKLGNQGMAKWLNVAGYRPKYGEPEWYPEHAKLIKQGSEVVEHGRRLPRLSPKRKVHPTPIKSPHVGKANERQKFAPEGIEKYVADNLPEGFVHQVYLDAITQFMKTARPGERCVLDVPADEAYAVMQYVEHIIGIVPTDIDVTEAGRISFPKPTRKKHATGVLMQEHYCMCRQQHPDPFFMPKPGQKCPICHTPYDTVGAVVISEKDLPF